MGKCLLRAARGFGSFSLCFDELGSWENVFFVGQEVLGLFLYVLMSWVRVKLCENVFFVRHRGFR